MQELKVGEFVSVFVDDSWIYARVISVDDEWSKGKFYVNGVRGMYFRLVDEGAWWVRGLHPLIIPKGKELVEADRLQKEYDANVILGSKLADAKGQLTLKDKLLNDAKLDQDRLAFLIKHEVAIYRLYVGGRYGVYGRTSGAPYGIGHNKLEALDHAMKHPRLTLPVSDET